MPEREHVLVFGARGAIGQAICQAAIASGWRVTGVSRFLPDHQVDGMKFLSFDPFTSNALSDELAQEAPYSSVCWAQGTNLNDSVYDVDIEENLRVYRANVLYTILTLKALLNGGLLPGPARMCVISSIWQNLAKQAKLSYCVSKAALQGFVLSASTDLAADGHLINAVLPGAIDTPMSRGNLSPDQVDKLISSTGFHRLTTLDDVTSLVLYLCSSANSGLTGQFITADLGFSHVRLI